ncbi:helix-turn-helix transcriptional regulator [Lamprobacter modestohalophilus]|uniref:helix-turn-helix domain-containing protein n=1 Tax=Lamprobacter modestohalophilus TaxID=1064514 RepID=UPI002ADEB362|nr:helix-turn-helix transcriptional regulator [Lamprobacter modestohalophilus]MEA1052493.1 helix-turn-helix transcriptional regulator [Lamprobacter modestohalophilus]
MLFSFYVDLSPLTQKEIADLAGVRPNNISMWKSGETQIPITRIPKLAEILRIDKKRFLLSAFRDYCPGHLNAIEDVFGSLGELDIA